MLMMGALKMEAALNVKGGARAYRALLLKEISVLHQKLTAAGISIFLFTHEQFEDAPDSVFVRDWFSTHPANEVGESTFVIYPQLAANRRKERRGEIINLLHRHYKRCVDLTRAEHGEIKISHTVPNTIPYSIPPPHKVIAAGKYLEFSALCLDRIHKIAYVSPSHRCSADVAAAWANELKYELVVFNAVADGHAVHHTSAVLFIGTGFAIFASSLVKDEKERAHVTEKLKATGHEIIEIDLHQVKSYCSEGVELNVNGTTIFVLSENAYHGFTDAQRATIEKHTKIIHSNLDNLEKFGGGSVGGIINQLF